MFILTSLRQNVNFSLEFLNKTLYVFKRFIHIVILLLHIQINLIILIFSQLRLLRQRLLYRFQNSLQNCSIPLYVVSFLYIQLQVYMKLHFNRSDFFFKFRYFRERVLDDFKFLVCG